MNNRELRFRIVDGLYTALIIVPMVIGMVIKVLTQPVSEGISIAGANIFFTVPFPVQDLVITESQVNSWLVIAFMLGVCLFMTHGMAKGIKCRRHVIAEWIVEKTDGLVKENMGDFFIAFSPFVGAIMAISACSSLLTLIGLYPPTSDLNVVAGWAILVFILITNYKLKGGLGNYLRGYLDPIFIMAPMNVVSELATPLAMSFRHYGNVLSGAVIAALVSGGLEGLSSLLLGWLPGVLGEIPFLKLGLPAILSIYFDIFSGCMQAFIFAMLTMMYVAGGFPEDLWRERQEKKKLRKSNA